MRDCKHAVWNTEAKNNTFWSNLWNLVSNSLWSKSKEKRHRNHRIQLSTKLRQKMTVLSHTGKTIGTTFTFRNKHPLKNSVINPMKIQFFERRGFCTQQLPSEKKKFTLSTRLSKRRKRRKPTENEKKREEKENEWYLKKQLQNRFCSKFLEWNCFQELTPYQVFRDKVPVTTRHRHQATGSQMKASEIKPKNWIAWL